MAMANYGSYADLSSFQEDEVALHTKATHTNKSNKA
jgi:hypothetical protein